MHLWTMSLKASIQLIASSHWGKKKLLLTFDFWMWLSWVSDYFKYMLLFLCKRSLRANDCQPLHSIEWSNNSDWSMNVLLLHEPEEDKKERKRRSRHKKDGPDGRWAACGWHQARRSSHLDGLLAAPKALKQHTHNHDELSSVIMDVCPWGTFLSQCWWVHVREGP